MRIESIVRLLGSSSTDPAVSSLLGAFGLHWRPSLDPDRPERFTDWFPVADRGIEFGFEDEAYLKALDPRLRGRSPLIFHEVIFYGEHSKLDRYTGDLPFGLHFSDSRDTVRARFARADYERRFHIRDVWELPDFRFIVTYAPDNSRVIDVICCLRESPWPPALDPLPPLPAPSTLVTLLGKPISIPGFMRAFQQLGVGYELDQMGPAGVIDLREEFGIDMHLGRPGAKSKGTPPILDSLTFYRDRDLDAHGWAGELPFGIRFADSPPEALAKVGSAPVRRSDRRVEGTALWHFDDFSLHLHYSTLENLVHRVTLMRPGLLGVVGD